jgi:rhodanese-related sulfurtransferase
MKKTTLSILLSSIIISNISATEINKDQWSGKYNSYLEIVKKEIKLVETKDLGKMMVKGDFLMIDIRTPEEINYGVINYPNLKIVNRHFLEQDIEEITKADINTKILIVCNSGKRSAIAAKSLKEMGYTDVSSLEGGITAWVEAGKSIKTEFGLMKLMK